MDYQLRNIAANKPAGTYFIVTDLSNAAEIMPNENMRLLYINESMGPVNTLVYFAQGATEAFQNLFGKRNRRSEKRGNFGIKVALEMLATGPLFVINLRAFDGEYDRTQLVSLGANKLQELVKESTYSELFNRTGFWTPERDNILKHYNNQDNLINFANVGEGDVTVIVTGATHEQVSAITTQYNKTIVDADLSIDQYPALVSDAHKLLADTFVNVYVFKNNFLDATTNVFYKHLFNEAGLINQVDIEKLTQIKASGFQRMVTGSLIPYLTEGTNQLSIDVLMNQFYQETGVYAVLNDEPLEFDDYNHLPVINTLAQGYHDEAGELIDNGNLLSYRYQANTPENVVTVNLPDGGNSNNYRTKENLIYTGEIFDTDEKYSNQVFGILENGVKYGDILSFKDKDSGEFVDTKVIQMLKVADISSELPKVDTSSTSFKVKVEVPETNKKSVLITIDNLNAIDCSYDILRKRPTDIGFVTIRTNLSEETFLDDTVSPNQAYEYCVVVKQNGFSPNFTPADKITVNFDAPEIGKSEAKPTLRPVTVKYTKVKLVTEKNINADSYSRRLRPSETPYLKVKPTSLIGYKQRPEQFTNGSSERQNEILDVMLTPSIVGGLSKQTNLGYLIDGFKSYVEAGFKKQFGLQIKALDECNRFVTAIVNAPFIKDLAKSVNPLFKDTPSGDLDLGRFLPTGGNQSYSTQFLSNMNSGEEMVFIIAGDNIDEPNTYPLAGLVANEMIAKERPWDIVANDRGILTIPGTFDPNEKDRKAMELFRWNPVIKIRQNYCIYGNMSGQLGNGALKHFNNCETLKYIKTELYNMSLKEGFTVGTYDSLLSFQTEVQNFMNSLAQQNAIRPNPIVRVLEVNDDETDAAGIKYVEVEYMNYRTLDKVVFNLRLK